MIDIKPNRWHNQVMINRKALCEVMRQLGKVKSAAKADAARRNGKLGGRPKILQVKPMPNPTV